MATSRGGNPPRGNGPSQTVLRTARRYVVACSKGLAEQAPLLRDGGYPSFAPEMEREAWHLEQVADRMAARLEQP